MEEGPYRLALLPAKEEEEERKKKEASCTATSFVRVTAVASSLRLEFELTRVTPPSAAEREAAAALEERLVAVDGLPSFYERKPQVYRLALHQFHVLPSGHELGALELPSVRDLAAVLRAHVPGGDDAIVAAYAAQQRVSRALALRVRRWYRQCVPPRTIMARLRRQCDEGPPLAWELAFQARLHALVFCDEEPPPTWAYRAELLRAYVRFMEMEARLEVHEKLYEVLAEALARSKKNDEEEEEEGMGHVTLELPGDARVSFRANTDMLNNVGLTTWPGGLCLAEYVAVRRPELVRGKRVVELGAGVGATSLCAAAAGASTVLATDYEESVLAVLRQNVQLNARLTETVSVRALDWTECVDGDELFDVVLGADVVYLPDVLPDLVRTLERLLRRVPGAVALLCNARRNPETYAKFLSLLDESGLVAERVEGKEEEEEEEEEEEGFEYDAKGLELLRIHCR